MAPIHKIYTVVEDNYMTNFTQAIKESDVKAVNFWIECGIDVNLSLNRPSLYFSCLENSTDIAPLTYAIDILLQRVEKILNLDEAVSQISLDAVNKAQDMILRLISANADMDVNIKVKKESFRRNSHFEEKTIQTSYIAWVFAKLPSLEKKHEIFIQWPFRDMFSNHNAKSNIALVVKTIKPFINFLLMKSQSWDAFSQVLDKGYVELTLQWLTKIETFTKKQQCLLQNLIAYYDAVDVLDKLKERNIILNDVDSYTGNNLAHLACESGHIVLVKRLLADKTYCSLFDVTNKLSLIHI